MSEESQVPSSGQFPPVAHDLQLQSRLDGMDKKLDRVLAAIFGGPDVDARPLKTRIEDLEAKVGKHGDRIYALEQAEAARAPVVAVAQQRFSLVEKIVFGVIALALTGIALALIKLVVGG